METNSAFNFAMPTFNLAIEVPAVVDVVHLGLLGLCLVFLLILLFGRTTKINASQSQAIDQKASAEPVDSAAATVSTLKDIDGEGALQLLALFQSEARLVDFIREDMAAYSDADIGAAARVVHKGLRQVFDEHFDVDAIVADEEGETITVPEGFKPYEIQLLGQVTGKGPFKGVLIHQGWRISEVRLPQVVQGRDSKVLAPAQVEL